MATSDLQRVYQQLRQIKNEALQAQNNLALMRKELELMVQRLSQTNVGFGTGATGTLPTQAGIQRATQQLLTQGTGRGGIQAMIAARSDPRIRTGGGNRLNLSKYAEDLDYMLQQIAQAKMDYAIQEARALSVVGETHSRLNLQERIQQILASMDQAIERAVNDRYAAIQQTIVTPYSVPGPFYAQPPLLPTGGLPPQYPQLPPGQPAYGAPFPDTPLLPAQGYVGTFSTLGVTPQGIQGGAPVIAGQLPEWGDDVVEAQFVNAEKVTTGELLLLEKNARSVSQGFRRMLDSTDRARRGMDQIAVEADGFEIPRDVDSGAGGDDPNRQPAPRTGRPAYPAVQRQFAKIYGEAGPERLAAIEQEAAKYGFEAKDIKSVETFAESYTRLKYEIKDTDGIYRRLTTTVDKAGNVLVSTQKQFRTFLGAIQRNISEMIKWSAAVLLVWGSIRKLQELIQLAIDNETQLANVAVVLGKNHADLSKIFNDAADAAYATGESINGVIEGYTAAYRATGNIENQVERARVAQVLLTDSLVLSKLSTLSQAEALDTLVGALRQVGYGLDEGRSLIDKWVKVSRFAQVSIETLAESFAITATSASNAGVDIDYLNGLIATIAEVTTLSASESGNAIRAFISSFKSDSAVKELGQYGIAVQDLQGETRGFLDIMKEIAALFEAGVISEEQLNKIGRAIGGRGARREAQVVAVIKNLARAEELAVVSADANGEAQAALNIQLETVQTTLTRLDNSFQNLARTMGSEGGVLSVTNSLLKLFTGVVEATATLSKNIGELTPVVAALGLAFAVTSKASRGLFAANLLSNIGGGINAVLGAGTAPRYGYGGPGQAPSNVYPFPQAQPYISRGERFRDWTYQPGLGGQFSRGSQLLGAGFALYAAGQPALEGDYNSAGGALAGAAIGFLVSGMNPVGAALGATAGRAIANSIFNYQGDFEEFWAEIVRDGTKKGTEDIDEADFDPMQDAINEALTIAGQGSATWGRLTTWFNSIGSIAATGIVNAFGAGLEPISREQFILNAARSTAGEDEINRVFQEARAYQEAQFGVDAESGFDFEFIRKQQEFLAEYGEYLQELEDLEAEAVRGRALGGDITTRELGDALEIIPKLQAGISTFAVGFGEEFRKLNPQISDAKETMEAFAQIIVSSAPEQIDRLNTLNSEIARITNLLQLAKDTGENFIIFKPEDESTEAIDEVRYSLQEAAEYLSKMKDDSAVVATNLLQAAQANLVQLPTVTTLNIDPGDIDKVFDRARKKQREFFADAQAAGFLEGLSFEEIEATFEPIMVQAGENGGYVYAEGFMSSFLSSVVPAMQQAGEIITPAPAALQLRQLDISSGELPGVLQRYQALVQNIREQARQGGFEVAINEETFAGLLNDYVAVPITADLSLLNLGMNELIDVNKKQLEGVYNLPTDSSFYVPFQGYELGLGQDGGAGGLGGAATDLTGSATDLRGAASDLRNAAIVQQRLAHGRAMGARYDTQPTIPHQQASRQAHALRMQGRADAYREKQIFERTQQWLNQERERGEPDWFNQLADLVPENVSNKFEQAVDSFNTGVDSQISFWDQVFGTENLKPPEVPPWLELFGKVVQDMYDGSPSSGAIIDDPQGAIDLIPEAKTFWDPILRVFLNIFKPSGGDLFQPMEYLRQRLNEEQVPGTGTGAGVGPVTPGLADTQLDLIIATLQALQGGRETTQFQTAVTQFSQSVQEFEPYTALGPPQPVDEENALLAAWNRALEPLVEAGVLGAPVTEPQLPPSMGSIVYPEQYPAVPDFPEQGEFWDRFIQWLSPLMGEQGVGGGAGIGTTDFLSDATGDLRAAATSLESLALPTYQQFGPPLPTAGITEFGADFGGVIDLLSQKISNLSGFTTNLKISSTTTTNLIVDGRTLAEVVKPYLYSDMIRFEASATSVTKNLVV